MFSLEKTLIFLLKKKDQQHVKKLRMLSILENISQNKNSRIFGMKNTLFSDNGDVIFFSVVALPWHGISFLQILKLI